MYKLALNELLRLGSKKGGILSQTEFIMADIIVLHTKVCVLLCRTHIAIHAE